MDGRAGAWKISYVSPWMAGTVLLSRTGDQWHATYSELAKLNPSGALERPEFPRVQPSPPSLPPSTANTLSLKVPGFEIERTLGKGGMATVYLATQESLGRKVALKTVVVGEEGREPSQTATANVHDTRSVERLIEEGRMIASLAHANIVSVFDIGATEDLLFIAMEYLQGGDLSARIGAGMPAKVALAVASSIASALEFSHANGVIHRDIKSANILFREDSTPVLSDFGIAKQVSKDAGLTQTGLVLGSPFYMSPEQIEGERLDSGSDIYNLGVVLFEMLTTHLPFQADDSYELMMKHLHAPVPELPLPLSAVQPLLNGMLAKGCRNVSLSSRF